jgi:DNA repair exonuclease SbcCD ATPase subunit
MTVDEMFKKRSEELKGKRGENALMDRQIADIEKRIVEAVQSLEIGQESLVKLEEVANARRGSMKGKIEEVVTEALRLLYGRDYRVELTYSTKANRSSLEIELVRDLKAGELRTDMGHFGGGVSDTISVPLRLLVMIGSKQTDKIAVLDECWKHVDSARVELVADFLKVLTTRLGIQVIMCSHHEGLRDRADKVFEVQERNGTSVVSVSGKN